MNPIMICGTNWLGDSVMSMPALQMLVRRNPSRRVTMLVKPGMAGLWSMHAAVAGVETVAPGVVGMLKAAIRLGAARPEMVYILPGSIRSALVPFLGGIRERVGAAGHQRRALLTRVVDMAPVVGREHQAWEYARILGVDEPGVTLDAPRLELPADKVEATMSGLGIDASRRWAAVVPGAARGPSKRWPAAHFSAVARALLGTYDGVLVLGAPSEMALCEDVCRQTGCGAVNLSGRTSICQMAAVLSRCEVTVCNDSGGMHLAAAAGSRVVAIYGLTDPVKTGPLGVGHRIVQRAGVARSRAIGRDSAAAARILQSITPEEVLAAVLST